MDTRALEQALNALQAQANELHDAAKKAAARPRNVLQEINAIPGRRLLYTLSGEIDFTAAQDGQGGAPITMVVSKDGPFVLTHYPVVSWRPSLPLDATNLGRYSSIRSYHLAVQAFNGPVTDADFIDISYQLFDAGSQGPFQNLTVSGQLISSAGNLMPLGMPSLFAPNSTIQFQPTYNNIEFSADPATPTTAGTLHVDLLGYRIVNN